MAVFVLLMSVFLFPPLGLAADAGAIAAALPDEASECRYLVNLCKKTSDAYQQLLVMDKKMEACLRGTGEPCPPAAAVNEAEFSMNKAGGDAASAAEVIRAKHEKMPACFQKCSHVLKLEKFK